MYGKFIEVKGGFVVMFFKDIEVNKVVVDEYFKYFDNKIVENEIDVDREVGFISCLFCVLDVY